MIKTPNTPVHAGHISMMQRSFGPRFLMDPENTDGDAAAAAAAAAAKEAADRTAKEAADKTAKEAADKAAAEDAARRSNLTDNEAKLLKEQMATKAKLEEATKKAEEAAAKLKAFEGLDPEKVKELVAASNAAEAAKKAAEEENLRKAGEFDRLKAMMVEEHKKETESLATEVTTTKTALEQAQNAINDLTVGASFSNSSYIKDELILTPTYARKIFGEYFDVEDRKPVGYDKPRGAANRTKLVNGSGEPMPFEDAIKKIIEASPDKDQLLRSKLMPGSSTKTLDVSARQREAERKATGPTGMARIQAALEAGAIKKKA
jgi:hypothetical protein